MRESVRERETDDREKWNAVLDLGRLRYKTKYGRETIELKKEAGLCAIEN